MNARTGWAAWAVLVVAAHGLAAAEDGPARRLEPARVSWSELHFAAHKLGISATVDVRASTDRPAGDPAAGRPREMLIESTSHLPGRTFFAAERVEPLEARARTIVNTEVGAKNHTKTYSLTSRGFLLDLLEPASHREAELPPERWTRRTRSFTVYPKPLPAGAAITGPAGLLYAVSAADLASPGDTLTVYALVHGQVETVTVRVEGVETVPLQLREGPDGTIRSVAGELPANRLVARSRPVDPDAVSTFRLFGLEGDVEILWDTARNVPVELRGGVKVLGRVEVRLVSATLRAAAAE